MPRIRFQFPSVKRSLFASELVKEKCEIDLLLVREDLISNDEVFECNGGVKRRKIIALEVLTHHMQVLVDGDDRPAMDVDESYPAWIAEKVMSELLPEPMVSCALDDGEGLVRSAKVCSWFESDTSTNDSSAFGSGGLSPVMQVMELVVEDLPCETSLQSKKLSVELTSLPVDKSDGVDEDFKKLRVQDFEATPLSSPLTLSKETMIQGSIWTLGDANLQTSTKADCRLAVEPFEPQLGSDGGYL